MFDEFGINAGYVEELHTRWLHSPQSVEEDWRHFFEKGNGAPVAAAGAAVLPGSTHRRGPGTNRHPPASPLQAPPPPTTLGHPAAHRRTGSAGPRPPTP